VNHTSQINKKRCETPRTFLQVTIDTNILKKQVLRKTDKFFLINNKTLDQNRNKNAIIID